MQKPENLTIQISGSNVQLSWDEVTGANSYKVYACDTPNGTFTDVTSTGTFGGSPTLSINSHAIGKRKYKYSRQNRLSTLNSRHSRATITWTAPITEFKKFYYVVAYTESGRKILRNAIKR